MVKKTITIFALLPFLLSSGVFNNQEVIKFEDVKAEIAKYFAQTKGEFAKITSEIRADTALAKFGNDFFKENFLYADYLTKHSENYMESITHVFGMYLLTKDQKISGFIEKPKKRFSVHDLKATAIRFIFPVIVTQEGKIGTRICVTGEGFEDYSERNIDFEAFTFDAIFTELKKKEKSFLLPRIQEYNNLMGRLKLSTNEQNLLTRAQGFMWALFYKDKDFEKMIIDCYQRKAEYMPFEIALE